VEEAGSAAEKSTGCKWKTKGTLLMR